MATRHMSVVTFFHSLWGHPALDATAVAIAQYGLAVSVAAFLVGFARRRPVGLIPWLVAGIVAAVIANLAAGHLVHHVRPFVTLGVAPLFPHAPDNGFPSDHSAVAAFIAAALRFMDAPTAVVATLAALAIGVARVYALVHCPSDIVAAWFIGAVPAAAAMLLWRSQNG